MGPVEAVLLGLFQGVTEFLPISSSAHLVVLPWLMDWPYQGLTFDVALHLGTLFAVVGYFWRDWYGIILGAARGLRKLSPFEDGQARLGWFLILGTIPGALAGALLEKQAEEIFRDIRLVAIMLIALGLVLYVAERLANHGRDLTRISVLDSVMIGLAQAFAIIPGVSRSGSTISMGLFRGLTRESAARFSFMLSTPIIFGASVKRLPLLFSSGPPSEEVSLLVLGTFSAAVASFATIALLLRYLRRHSTLPFIVYRVVAGVALLVLAAVRGV